MKEQFDTNYEAEWKEEVKKITIKAAETSWPLTAFCCFFFIFVEIGNRHNEEYFSRFCYLDFGAGIIVFLAHLLRNRINYPTAVITYGSSILVSIVSTIAAVISVPENVFTYFWIVSMITVVRGLLYCQKISTVAAIAFFSHALIVSATCIFRNDSYYELPNILSTNIIQLFMVMFALSGANIRYKLTKTNFINSYRIKAASIMLEDKNRDITDSINYARRIQASLLASQKILKQNLPGHFIFFQPKDIVSGDFYWASDLQNGTFAVAVADSTGHGVPGAIMSILNISCLNEAVNSAHATSPDEILNYARNRIMEHMANDGSDEGGKDGMDCVLACFNFKENKMEFAAANNPLWLVREGQLIDHAPDKMPVGKPMGQIVPFTLHQLDLKKGDLIIMITDGFADQFGGPRGKKFMYKALKELIIALSNEPMEEISSRLKMTLDEWKGTYEQVDDILVFGIRI